MTLNNKNNDYVYSTNQIENLLKSHNFCDHCIGRLCTRRKNDETFVDAGKRIREQLSNVKNYPTKKCELCQGIVNELPDFYDLVKDSIDGFEFKTFLIGSVIDEDILEKEKDIISEYQLENTASLKQEINEYIGLHIEEEFDFIVDFKRPDIMIIVNTQFYDVSLQIKSVYMYGRYTKLKRGIPQTKWFCKRCHGKGCRYCKYSGKLYPDSVEEIIAKPAMECSKAEDESFHGAGREDIDVRMMGNGRPFVLELKNPKIRSLPLSEIKEEIEGNSDGNIKVSNLKITKSDDIARLKEACFQKVYVVKIHATSPIQKEKLKKVALSLQGTTINQQTPTRVEKRRVKKIRKRKIYRCSVLDVDETRASLEIESESGTYIKELVTGDNGKTKPNISQLLENACTVETLDVIEIKGE